MGLLIAARAVQGAGAALVMPLAVALLSAGTPAERRGRALGTFEALTGFATIAGPPLGGLVAQQLGWPWIFWINVPIAAVLIVAVRHRIPESRGPRAGFDTGGLALVTAGTLGLVWGLVQGNVSGWTSPPVLVPLVAGALAMAVFVRYERRADPPMLPMHWFGSRAFTGATAASFLLFATLYGSVFLLPQFLQAGLGYGPLQAGLALVPWTATLFAVAPLAGAAADRFGNRIVLIGGLTVQAGGLAWIAAITGPATSYAALVVPLVVTGIGTSAAIPVVQNAVLGAVPAGDVGTAAGVSNATQEMGGVFGVAIVVAVLTASLAGVTGVVAFALGTCTIMALGATLCALAIPRHPALAQPSG